MHRTTLLLLAIPAWANTVPLEFEYTITANNDSPDIADGVSIIGATPSGLALLSATINGVNCQNSLITTLTCAAGEIPSGGQVTAVATYTLSALVTPGTPVNFTTSAVSEVYDPNIVNNTASVTVVAQ